MYQPTNPQNAQQFGINPFQKVVIDLVATPLTQAQPFPQFEGDYIIVEQADYPVIISIVNPASGVTVSYPCIPGMQIEAPFKGFFLQCPALTNNQSTVALNSKLVLVIGKGTASKHNDLANPYTSLYPPYLPTTNTGTALIVQVHIPDGVRYINKLAFTFQATTVTAASLSVNSRGSQPSPALFPHYGPAVAEFTTASLATCLADSFAVAGAFCMAVYTDIPIPVGQQTNNLLGLAFVGTGMSPTVANSGIKMSCQ